MSKKILKRTPIKKKGPEKIAKRDPDKITKKDSDKIAKKESDRITKKESDKVTKKDSEKITKKDSDKIAKKGSSDQDINLMKNDEYIIEGKVVNSEGYPLVNLNVKVFSRELRKEIILGDTKTNNDGYYKVIFHRNRPTIIVSVFRDGTKLTSSSIIFNPGRKETINLTIDSHIYGGLSEYERLEGIIKPFIKDIAIAKLNENKQNDDISILSGKTFQNPKYIAFLVKANRLKEQTQIPAEVYYGLFRKGVSTQLSFLLTVNSRILQRTLENAVRENIIPKDLEKKIPEIIEKLKDLKIKNIYQASELEEKSQLSQLINIGLPNKKHQLSFFSKFSDHKGTLKEFWKKLDEESDLKEPIKNLKSVLQLGEITKGNIPLVKEIFEEISNLSDIVAFKKEKWDKLIEKHGFTPNIPGKNDETKAKNYFQTISHMIENIFPTKFLAKRIEENNWTDKSNLLNFFNKNLEFNIRTSNIDKFISENPKSIENLTNTNNLKKKIKAIQRLYKIVPNFEQMNSLLKDDIDSSYKIAQMGHKRFIAKYKNSLGMHQAKYTYEKALQIHGMSLNLLSEYGMRSQEISMPVLGEPTSLMDVIPDWNTLFGSIELCECEHCKSVLSPTAYFVDVLHFLQNRSSNNEGESAKDVIFSRRPDLGDIELSCENTLIPLPYVDLVNEILENAVFPFEQFQPFELRGSLESDLNNRNLSDNLRNSFQPPLSKDAVINIGNDNQSADSDTKWWIIDELAFSYTIRKEDNKILVESRSLQTKGSPSERATNPQYINLKAYEELNKQVFPWSIPYDHWAEETKVYLKHLGVPLFEIMENFLPGEREVILENPEIAFEHLGIFPEEVKIITGLKTKCEDAVSPGIWNLWGFNTKELDELNSIQDPSDSIRRISSGNWLNVIKRVDVFLQQSELKYKDLLSLLDTAFINPKKNIVIVSTTDDNLDTCETGKMQINGLSRKSVILIMRFVRLWRKLGWSMADLDRAILVFGTSTQNENFITPADLNSDFLTKLSHVVRLTEKLNLPLHKLLSFWATNLSEENHLLQWWNASYIDYNSLGNPKIPSLYTELFRNKTVINPLDPGFTTDPKELTGKLSEHTDTISAVLGISGSDFTLLLNDSNIIPKDQQDPPQPDDKLILEYLANLYRHAALANGLKLRIYDYLVALNLIKIKPFDSTKDTLLFIEKISEVIDAGFNFIELDYLLRHNIMLSTGVGISDDVVSDILGEIRVELQKIISENIFNEDEKDPNGVTIDPDGEITSQKLTFLNWDEALLEEVMANLNGSTIYEALLDQLPAGLELPNELNIYEIDLDALPQNYTFPPELESFVNYDDSKKKLKTTRILAIPERSLLTDSTDDQNFKTAVEELFKLQDNLQGKITFDTSTKKLSFYGPMTNKRYAYLKTVSNDNEFLASLEKLYNAPRNFIKRFMKIFSIHDFDEQLTNLPANLKFPPALKKRIYYDFTVEPKLLHSFGPMTESDRELILSLSDQNDPHYVEYATAVNNLFNKADALVPEPDDVFITEDDVKTMFDESNTPEKRFLLVLKKLFPYLRKTLSERLVKQKIAEALKLDFESAENLLTKWIASPFDQETDINKKRRCITEFLDPNFYESSLDIDLTSDSFYNQFKVYTLLYKISTLVNKFKINPRQLEWLFKYGPSVGWLDLNSIPTNSDNTAASIEKFLRIILLFKLRDLLPLGENALNEILELAGINQTSYLDILEIIYNYTTWNETDLIDLAASDCFNILLPADYFNERNLLRIKDCFDLMRRLGMTANQCKNLVKNNLDQIKAQSVKQAARAKYDDKQWLDIAKPLRNALREKQRAALVAFLVRHLKVSLPILETPHPILKFIEGQEEIKPAVKELQQKLNAAGICPKLIIDGVFNKETEENVKKFQETHQLENNGIVDNQTWSLLDKVRRGFRDTNELYAYFLIDIEMNPCMMTSRIKQAISSTQLFIQRCLMNLEPNVIASSDVDEKWLDWKWMKNYRVWEANRKVFLYPENWIEPELRDNKSPFFEDLENELMQNDVTNDTAEIALKTYLEKLDQVSHLEIVAIYHQQEEQDGFIVLDILHVIGRTKGIPHKYYYRQRKDSAYWTPWESIEADIEGEHLLLAIWNRRLFIFWLIFTKKARPFQQNMPAKPGGSFNSPIEYWEIKLAWTERKYNKWESKKLSTNSIEKNVVVTTKSHCVFEVRTPDMFLFRSIIDDNNDLRIPILVNNEFWCYFECGWCNFAKVKAFHFNGYNSDPIIIDNAMFSKSLVEILTGTDFQNMFLQEEDESSLYLHLTSSLSDTVALEKTPGIFKILPYSNGFNIRNHPFFYVNDKKSFFIIPTEILLYHLGQETQFGESVGESESLYEELITSAEEKYTVSPYSDLSYAIHPSLKTEREIKSIGTLKNNFINCKEINLPTRQKNPSSVEKLNLGDKKNDRLYLGKKSAIKSIISSILADPQKSASQAGPGFLIRGLRYLFQTFYHPYISAFLRELNKNGIEGLLKRKIQTEPHIFLPRLPSGQVITSLNFESEYEPEIIVREPYPIEDVDFSFGGPYSLYNWELFFHIPHLIADRLSNNQRFEEAQKWFHYIFNPTDTSSYTVPKRYWQTKEFFDKTDEDYQKHRIQYILKLVAFGGDPTRRLSLNAEELKDLEEFENIVQEWRDNPFKPHLIARMRTTAYQKNVVMKYIDNLVSWGDRLFRRDTIESINEAAQLYILAFEILGRRPENVPPRVKSRIHTFNTLEPFLDEFGNAIVQAEEFVSTRRREITYNRDQPPLTLPTMLYFCIPKNDILLGYWDLVADRLFKIRNCMNIEGVVRQLPLFEPPIDPAMLVRAAAAGIDISSVLNDISATLPHYRFNVLAQKANELCSELKSLGSSLLSALEKRDAEDLALIRTKHENSLLELIKLIKEQQLEEAEKNEVALRKSRDMIAARYIHYQKLLGVQDSQSPAEGDVIPDHPTSELISIQDEDGVKVIPHEKTEMMMLEKSNQYQDKVSEYETLSGIMHIIPNINIEPWGVGATFGGSNLGSAMSAYASYYRGKSARFSYEATRSAKLAHYAMRGHDWTLQSNQAAKELMHTDVQIEIANLRKKMTQQELTNHIKQIENAKEIEEFMRSKYTNKELYNWMIGQISSVYFQSYQLVYDIAKRAERAYQFELGVKDSNFIKFGYWDSLKKGLLAGERLNHDIKRMEISYLEKNKREYEITKHISLAQLDPVAFTQLKQMGECYISIPEVIFDLDYPGHYFRRIKSLSLTIPCVTGPYTSVSSTLTMISNSIRRDNTLLKDKYMRQEEDPRFSDGIGFNQSIVTSSGQNDSGIFELNFRDERYLPFEGTGVISEWHIELPRDFRNFNYDTISDLILHIKYTAREGGEPLKQQVNSELRTTVNEFIDSEGNQGFSRLFSLRHEFSNNWHSFLNPPAGSTEDQKLIMNLTKQYFPFMFQDRDITINAFQILIKIAPNYVSNYTDSTLMISLKEGTELSNDPLALTIWKDLLSCVKQSIGNPGDWTLTAWIEQIAGTHEHLNPEAIEDILVICYYNL